MPPIRHIHETYIKSSPERIWQALTDPEFTRRWFFDTSIQSGWEPGGGYQYLMADGSAALGGTIVEFDPPRRLVMTFNMLYLPEAAAEPESEVTWEIIPVGEGGDLCRVTLLHGDLALSPVTWQRTGTGWPVLLSSVKSLVETGEPLGEVPEVSGSPFHSDEPPDREWHRSQAREANNGIYGLLDEVGASADHADRLLHQVHAAAYHWGIAGTIEHRARAEYLCSRVHAYLGRPESALQHAHRCRELIEEAGMVDWDLAFAHEALARASACAGDLEAASSHRRAAAAVPVEDPQDWAIVEADMAAGPWFGLEPDPSGTTQP